MASGRHGSHKTIFHKYQGSACLGWEYFRLGEPGSGFKYLRLGASGDLKMYSSAGCAGTAIYTFDPSWLGELRCPPGACVEDEGLYRKVSGTGFDPSSDLSPTCSTTTTTDTITSSVTTTTTGTTTTGKQYIMITSGNCVSRGHAFVTTRDECIAAGAQVGTQIYSSKTGGNRQKYCGTWGGNRWLMFNSQTSGYAPSPAGRGSYPILQNAGRDVAGKAPTYQICEVTSR